MERQSGFTSKLGFILASAGSAIGLGAMWKFPYVMADNGGAAFLILFIIFTLFIGLPILMSEFVMGVAGETYSTRVFSKLSGKKKYDLIGYLGNIGVFLLMSFYSVIGGFILIYIIRTIKVMFTGDATKDYTVLFGSIISNPLNTIAGVILFLALTGIIVIKGVQNGIERVSKFMMPMLFVMFLIMIIRSITLPNAMKGVSFFLNPDFNKLDQEAVLFALGQSFFSLSVGFGGMLTYASYMKKGTDLVQAGGYIVLLNILVTLLAGLAIFPATASLGIDNAQGPGLLFIVLPYVFNQLPFGSIFYLIFLLLFFFATITSSINLVEINVSNMTKNDNTKRMKSVLVIILGIFIVSIPCALSFGPISDMKFLKGTFFDNMDFLVSNIMLPIGVLCYTLFSGYVLDKKIMKAHFVQKPYQNKLFNVWIILLRYVIPIVILFVMINQLVQ
ncbi:sodium-dependent transporter [Macrococcoides caseolyticum]|uniref:sodium-dependent transporter n=1 Tax=Macrococcoides caseolyticum TaxID=69966 RepID=UPI00105C1493|nr:sodium-dependent transporter [Macrococcus caseolyticus]TDM16199.1 sodium-dependent transporter [Macrococcus caseolyticus]VUC65891.1 sodium-dependent transporter [Macrococcus caseolyticus]